MNFKSEKGFTGIDITVAIIVITLFVSIISVVFYNITISAKKLERKTEATYIAQDVIEKIKALDYGDVLETKNEDNQIEEKEITDYKDGNLVVSNKYEKGYTIKIKVEIYNPEQSTEGSATEDNDLVKIITVNVSYKIGKDIETVELTTTIVRNV